MLFPHESFWNR